MSKLTKVSEIELGGVKFDVAKNGNYHLVTNGEDAYGRPVAKLVDLKQDAYKGDTAQGLLDLLGAALEQLQAGRDARERRMGAEV